MEDGPADKSDLVNVIDPAQKKSGNCAEDSNISSKSHAFTSTTEDQTFQSSDNQNQETTPVKDPSKEDTHPVQGSTHEEISEEHNDKKETEKPTPVKPAPIERLVPFGHHEIESVWTFWFDKKPKVRFLQSVFFVKTFVSRCIRRISTNMPLYYRI